MKFRLLLPLACLLGAALPEPGACRELPDGLYFGQAPPGTTPEVFAPGVVSLAERYEYSVTFSPALDECVFGVTNNFWNVFTMMFTAMDADSAWSEPVTAPFQGIGDGLSAAYSHGGDRVTFASTRPSYPPANLWFSTRDGVGWTEPAAMAAPVNSNFDEWAPAFAAGDVLYFVSYRPGGGGSADIYRSVPVGGEYLAVENLGPPVNGPFIDSTPCIAPDESWLIFESGRPGGYGHQDLYLSRREGDSWSEPENLGPDINTEQIEDGPYVSPDGLYLFFNRREDWVTNVPTDLWWVDVRAVLGGTAAEDGEAAGPPAGGRLGQNYPNPFNPSTVIPYTVPADGFVSIRIHDARGREVGSLVNRRQRAGPHAVTFRPKADSGLPSGVLYCRLLLQGEPQMTRKMLLLK